MTVLHSPAVSDRSGPIPGRIEVVRPGVQTTVQDGVGRTGLWDVGVPPSGPFDGLSFALAAAAVGNDQAAAGLECVLRGPVLEFQAPATVCVTGAATAATVDGQPVPVGVPVPVSAGAVLDLGKIAGPGMRGYLAVAGGLQVPQILGSRSTFILGKFGGIEGRPLRQGDSLTVGAPPAVGNSRDVSSLLPRSTGAWTLRVRLGPHGAPDYLTADGVSALLATRWTVDHRSDRTGIRLTGPAPLWARHDGGEAGLHPSNVHDSAYPVGGIMLSGDTPVIVGPDGPSLGGFVVPCVVIGADLWQLGQLRPGDQVNLVAVTADQATAAAVRQRSDVARANGSASPPVVPVPQAPPAVAPLVSPTGRSLTGRSLTGRSLTADAHRPAVVISPAGDRHLLVEAGPGVFDLTVRVWIHLLAHALRSHRPAGVSELVEGVRSLLVKYDDTLLTHAWLAAYLLDLAVAVPDPQEVTLSVREVTLPIAFDHPEVHEAMNRYRSVNPTAPWNPDNVEFIRRVNDLDDRNQVFDIVQEATYLVVGLGDVYLGAPVAVPLDPRHRLVTTKYSPARTWTPQNAVGIGGIYLCVYGMEGPGGYQLVGRTVPVWRTGISRDEQPWLLRQFDRIRFTPVSGDELAERRREIHSGAADLVTRPAVFSLAEVTGVQEQHADEIMTLRARRQQAFQAERARWAADR